MIVQEWRSGLHAYLGGIARENGVDAKAIGGVADHVHLLLAVKASTSIPDLVRDLKSWSSRWGKDRFAGFAWQRGYSVFSVSFENVEKVAQYIAHQEQHHRKVSSLDELKALLAEAQISLGPTPVE
jgi:REP element-mobilizing transposase RayT